MGILKTIECMSQVSGKIALAKDAAGRHLRESNPEAYKEIREHLNDCQELMAIFCDCAPIKLIAGNIEDIMKGLR